MMPQLQIDPARVRKLDRSIGLVATSSDHNDYEPPTRNRKPARVRGRLLPMFGYRGQVPNTQNNRGRKIVLPAANHNET